MFENEFIRNALLAGFFAGISSGVIGVFLVTTHLSFLGVCMAHAAFAGALMGLWLGINPMAQATLFSVLSALIIGPLADRGELSLDTSAGILFSFMLGLAFLFMGLMPGSQSQALGLFWGSILTVSRTDLWLLGGVTVGALATLIAFYKEILAVLCHRKIAIAVGIPATLVLYALLLWSAVTIAVSLRITGGLLVYSLVVNPAAAAYQLSYRLRVIFIVSAVFGVISCWTGLACSFLWDLPAGASIVIVSCIIFALSMLLSRKNRSMAFVPEDI